MRQFVFYFWHSREGRKRIEVEVSNPVDAQAIATLAVSALDREVVRSSLAGIFAPWPPVGWSLMGGWEK